MEWLFNIIGFILLFLAVGFAPFVCVGIFYYIYFHIVKGMKAPEKKFVSEVKKTNFFKRLFIDFPKRFVLDKLTVNPNEFGYFGFHLFVGEQGSGKTVAVAEFLGRLKREYPLMKIATNFDYTKEDSKIDSWQNLIFNNNGIYGQADVIDEVQNWFSSNQSKDFPPEMIQEITQQRKQRKILIGTTQRFERMAKPLREQVNYIYKPLTIAGCLTIVSVFKPTVNHEGVIEKMRPIKRYFFIHNDEIRNSFDTYKKIEKQAEGGFHVDNQQDITVNTVFENVKPKSRKK